MTARTASVHNTTQNSFDNLPSYLQTNIIADMLSIREEGVTNNRTTITYHREYLQALRRTPHHDLILSSLLSVASVSCLLPTPVPHIQHCSDSSWYEKLAK